MGRQFPAFRGLAIFLVVVNHSITLTLESYNQAVNPQIAPWLQSLLSTAQSLGLLAVPIFLFLSGAYMVYATRSKDLVSAYRGVLPGLRYVLVPYLIWSSIFYALIYFTYGESYSLLGYLRNFVIGFPYNFVPILVFFYLIGPILVRVLERFPVSGIIFILVYQIITANVLRPSLLGIDFPQYLRWLTIPGIRLSMAVWGVFYPLGILNGLYRDRVSSLVNAAAGWLVAASVALFAMVLVHNLTDLEIPISQLLFPMAALLLIPIIKRESIPFFPWLERLGKMAYGLYLTNLTLISLGLLIVDSILPFLYSSVVLLIVILVILTIILVTALFRGMAESPAAGMRRYLFG